ncbi:hypothetical protein ACR6C2_25565 [Streptomyces sp. INA 01156]
MASVHIICKDTEKEAREYLEYVEEKGDYESALRYKHIIQNGDSRGWSWDHYKKSEDPKQDESIKTFFRPVSFRSWARPR